MTDFVWTGATNGNFQTATNWNPNGTPTGSDRVFFNSTSVVDVDAGLSNPSFDGQIYIARGYTGQIGNSAGDALDCGDVSWISIENGSNERWITATTVTRLTLADIQGLSDFGSVAGTTSFTDIVVRNCSGGFSIGAGTTLNGRIAITGSDGFTLTIPSGTTMSAVTVVQSSGVITTASGHDANTNWYVLGGRSVFTGTADLAGSTHVYGYGRRAVVDHQSTGDIDGIVRVIGPQALFDGRQNNGALGVVDVTAEMEVGDGGRLMLRNGQDTYLNTQGIRNLGGGITDFEVAEEFSKS